MNEKSVAVVSIALHHNIFRLAILTAPQSFLSREQVNTQILVYTSDWKKQTFVFSDFETCLSEQETKRHS